MIWSNSCLPYIIENINPNTSVYNWKSWIFNPDLFFRTWLIFPIKFSHVRLWLSTALQKLGHPLVRQGDNANALSTEKKNVMLLLLQHNFSVSTLTDCRTIRIQALSIGVKYFHFEWCLCTLFIDLRCKVIAVFHLGLKFTNLPFKSRISKSISKNWWISMGT